MRKDKNIILAMKGCAFQNINFCFIKICFEAEDEVILYSFNSVKVKISSKSGSTRNAALNSHV